MQTPHTQVKSFLSIFFGESGLIHYLQKNCRPFQPAVEIVDKCYSSGGREAIFVERLATAWSRDGKSPPSRDFVNSLRLPAFTSRLSRFDSSFYSTVTLFARLRGLSTSYPLATQA